MDYNQTDLTLLKKKGITESDIERQLSNFQKGFQCIQLKKAATVNDGILQIASEKEEELLTLYERYSPHLQMVKMVPASGSATRMFKDLFQFLEVYQETEEDFLAFIQSPKQEEMYHFFSELEEYPFYGHLEEILCSHHKNLRKMLDKKAYKEILAFILEKKGLNYSNTPKGLVDFHVYKDFTRTAFDEHLVEGALYCSNGKSATLHFTVAGEHLSLFKKRLENISKIFEKQFQIKFNVTFSIQKPSTDTISIDEHGEILRDTDGKIIFRPGGHGALIHNLNELKADVVFIKNIDNVSPDRSKKDTIKYKKLLAGTLLKIQQRVFSYLRLLDETPTPELLEEIEQFTGEIGFQKLAIPAFKNLEEKRTYFHSLLNRPIRVCGMVKNEGEPGGGPFWATSSEGHTRLMIIESAQINLQDQTQLQIFKSSTHFNPVDLVCGIKNYKGDTFDLTQFIDINQGFITKKSYQGKEIIVQELPGLWNGAMANWLTLFVEVPLTTFTPVKTVFDLFRIEHRNIL